ncbi:MAG: hypothetical protein LBE09_05060 [Christensenellaceae bacterium]|jgi:hypothetical protein|nr:hypothetical protein [Christensenellaceae bacterium]
MKKRNLGASAIKLALSHLTTGLMSSSEVRTIGGLAFAHFANGNGATTCTVLIVRVFAMDPHQEICTQKHYISDSSVL